MDIGTIQNAAELEMANMVQFIIVPFILLIVSSDIISYALNIITSIANKKGLRYVESFFSISLVVLLMILIHGKNFSQYWIGAGVLHWIFSIVMYILLYSIYQIVKKALPS